jgi:hypothetical protein
MGTISANQCAEKHNQAKNAQPRWFVIHGGVGAQRYRWSDWAARTADCLVRTGQWVIYQDGDQVELKHRCMLVN